MLILNNVEIVTFSTDCTSTPELLFGLSDNNDKDGAKDDQHQATSIDHIERSWIGCFDKKEDGE